MVYYSGIIPCCMIFLKQFTVVVFHIYYTAAGVTQQLKICLASIKKKKKRKEQWQKPYYYNLQKKEKKKRTMAEALLLQSRFWVGIDIKMWPG